MAFDPEIQGGVTQEQAEWIGRLKDQVRTDPRTRTGYPEDGTIVSALFYGDAHWYTGRVRTSAGRHYIDCPVGDREATDCLKDAAHWYEPV